MRSRADKLRAIINCPTVNPNERRAAQRALEKHEGKASPRPRTVLRGARFDGVVFDDIFAASSRRDAWRTKTPPNPVPPEAPKAEHGYEGRWERDTRGRDGRVLTFDVKRDDAPSYIRGTAVRVKAPDGKVYDCRVLAVRLCPRYQPSHVITEPFEQAARTTFWM